MGAVPIINQNDTVSVIDFDDMLSSVQVCFADNDKLSALVASELDADLLLILSDVDGLFDANPKVNPNAKIIKEVKGVTDDIRALGTDASEGGRGGMRTKLEAARLVTRFGGRVLIANGKIPYVISEIFNQKDIGTMFVPNNENLSEKKRWIGYATNIFGKSVEELVIDGIQSKLVKINEESQVKLQDTMQKIVNDSNGGLVCIII